MRISDILRESANSITTYLALIGSDIAYYEQKSQEIKNQYESSPTPLYRKAAQNYLNEINIRILHLVADNSLWDRFRSDPEISIVYDRFVNLYNANDDYLEEIR
jgi:hypothetical protein